MKRHDDSQRSDGLPVTFAHPGDRDASQVTTRLQPRPPPRAHRPGIYYGPVRLPSSVHRRRMSLDFPTRPAAPSATGEAGISRLPRKVFPYVPGVYDRAGSRSASRYRRPGCGLPHPPTASAPQSNSFRGSIPGPHVPLSTLHPRPRGRRRMTRGRRGSLALRRLTLPFTTPCRFVPAHRG